ncbi:MAG: hypothetical protein IJ052_02925, partial [Oscillospiraceae bacterium]|nr:hypothetical protein [Oscillospiraceae bacterium]
IGVSSSNSATLVEVEPGLTARILQAVTGKSLLFSASIVPETRVKFNSSVLPALSRQIPWKNGKNFSI